MVERTEETIEDLAYKVAEDMDYNDLLWCAILQLQSNYEDNLDLFNEDWESNFGENND